MTYQNFLWLDSVWIEIKINSIGAEFHQLTFSYLETKNGIAKWAVDEVSFYPLNFRNHKSENILNLWTYLKSKE